MKPNDIFVGVAYRKPVTPYRGGVKSPCLCADLNRQYSQHQLYPMVMTLYETTNTTERKRGMGRAGEAAE